MHVVVNLLLTLKAKTGIGHYAARVFEAMQKQAPPNTLSGFPDGRLASLLQSMHGLRPAISGGTPSARSSVVDRAKAAMASSAKHLGRRFLASAFRRMTRGGQFDLYHETNFLPFESEVPTIVSVHDLSVLLHPEWHPADRVRHHEREFQRGIAQARHILTLSESVRSQIVRHLGVAPQCVTAVHCGVGEEYFAAGSAEARSTKQELGLPDEYLLYVGTIEPRKNVLTILRAFCDLGLELRRRCPLVLAGGWGWKSSDVAEFLRGEGADCGIVHLGYTIDRHLPGLYAGARALVFPSHYEGFGLPPVEALACGTAVIASTAEAVREVLGTRAHFIDPLDIDGWRKSLERAITEDDWLAEIRRGGRDWASRYTWDRCATATLDAYRTALGTRKLAA